MDKKLEKDDLIQILDRNTSWIENCDTKASIILGALGVAFGILLASDYLKRTIKIFDFIINNLTFWNVVYLVFVFIAIIGIIFGCILLVMVLTAKINIKEFSNRGVQKDSLIFFNTIANNKSLKEYKKKISSCSEQNFIDDLTSQIYSCSIICSKKFVRYKKGLLLSLSGFGLYIIMAIIGLIFT